MAASILPARLGVVMINVTDMDRSVAFYRDTLGLPLRFQSEYWTEFATETVSLALHGGAGPPAPARSGPAAAGTVAIGWEVADLDAICSALKARGVRFAMEPTDRRDEGIRLAVFVDADGCPLSLAQPLG